MKWVIALVAALVAGIAHLLLLLLLVRPVLQLFAEETMSVSAGQTSKFTAMASRPVANGILTIANKIPIAKSTTPAVRNILIMILHLVLLLTGGQTLHVCVHHVVQCGQPLLTGIAVVAALKGCEAIPLLATSSRR